MKRMQREMKKLFLETISIRMTQAEPLSQPVIKRITNSLIKKKTVRLVCIITERVTMILVEKL